MADPRCANLTERMESTARVAQIGRTLIDLTESEALTLAALLRFQSAMTPEMWAEVDVKNTICCLLREDHPTPYDRLFKALDTLRQELQQS